MRVAMKRNKRPFISNKQRTRFTTGAPRRESKSAKYECRRSCTGCCWDSDQGECLRLFGRSLPRDFSMQSRLLVNLTLSWTPNLVIMEIIYIYIYIHIHTRIREQLPSDLCALSALTNETTEKSSGGYTSACRSDFRPKKRTENGNSSLFPREKFCV